MTVAGVMPRAVVEPQTIGELAECVTDLYAHDRPFAFAGGGTELGLGNPPHSLDTLVRTTACNGVVDYAPQDQTVTVESGMTIAALGEVLAREGQFLPIDAPDPDRTTIGGAIATNLYGGRRLRYGSIRDIIVGVEIVRPDGLRARGGGKVVKNVAGFDMPKLMVGSLGTLGAIVSATFRVYPIEEQRATIVYAGLNIDAVMNVGSQLVGDALVPAAVTALSREDGNGYDCSVTFEGFARGVDQQMRAAAAIGLRLGLESQAYTGDIPGSFAARERAIRSTGDWRLALSARPTALAHFLSATAFTATTQRVIYPLLGAAFIATDTLDPATVARWRATLEGGTIVVNAMPQNARAALDAWGEMRADSLAIMRRLKTNFDPKGLCNVGRFVGGL